MELLQTIKKENQRNRNTMFVVMILSIIVSCIVSVFSILSIKDSKDTIYALDNENNMIVFNQVNENRQAEAEGHFKAFHNFFFNLPPDGEAIKDKITNNALELIDHSGVSLYNKFVEQDFYNNIIVRNITQELHIDSIKVTKNHPYQAKLWGKIYLIGQENILVKTIETYGMMRNTNARSAKNPHAFTIENFRILKYEDFKNLKRVN